MWKRQKTHNHWLNLTAGAVRFFKFGSPHQVFGFIKVSAPQSCGKLAKTLYAYKIRRVGMKKILILLIVFSVLITGCDYVKNRKYSGKVFDVRVEFWEGDRARVEIWKNANELSYDAEENIYTFYVDGKLVEIDNASSIVLTEIGGRESISAETEKYVGKKFDLSILHGKDIIKTWNNVEIKSASSRDVQFIAGGVDLNIMPSINETIIIEEVGKIE